ncbi:rod-binding protein [Caulobacter sp. KR2-114]|uniref:rod-binding protein n=1 Tax=Caulobacter sp. KR2-114 TaxID=3400912 RepID=UPI003C0782DC
MDAAVSVPVDLTSGAATAASAADLAKRGKIDKTAKDFESSFLNIMFQQMFKDVGADNPYGGGQGEEMWKSFLTDAMAKQTVKRGGIGLAQTVEKEMLKLQGLSA